MKCLKFNNPDMSLYMKSMGKLFRVTAVCKTMDEANRIMERDRDQAMICRGLQRTGLLGDSIRIGLPIAFDQRLTPEGYTLAAALVLCPLAGTGALAS